MAEIIDIKTGIPVENRTMAERIDAASAKSFTGLYENSNNIDRYRLEKIFEAFEENAKKPACFNCVYGDHPAGLDGIIFCLRSGFGGLCSVLQDPKYPNDICDHWKQKD